MRSVITEIFLCMFACVSVLIILVVTAFIERIVNETVILISTANFHRERPFYDS